MMKKCTSLVAHNNAVAFLSRPASALTTPSHEHPKNYVSDGHILVPEGYLQKTRIVRKVGAKPSKTLVKLTECRD